MEVNVRHGLYTADGDYAEPIIKLDRRETLFTLGEHGSVTITLDGSEYRIKKAHHVHGGGLEIMLYNATGSNIAVRPNSGNVVIVQAVNENG